MNKKPTNSPTKSKKTMGYDNDQKMVKLTGRKGSRKSYKGFFKPLNPHKYRGDPTKIVYRSSWEAHFFAFLDKHPHVQWWQSEELVIWYRSPKDGKKHRYFPDVITCVWDENIKDYKVIVIEIKPFKQTIEPDPSKKFATPSGRVSRKYFNEKATYEINKAKWEAAEAYCNERGWKFEIYTEKELGVR